MRRRGVFVMGRTAVIYKSKYGGAKQYAKWIAAALEADLFQIEKNTAGKLGGYSTIIYGAGIYAGSIAGFSAFKEIFNKNRDKNFILYTVALTSPENAGTFKAVIDRAFNAEMHAKIKTFHFRGGIDYKNLTFVHRAMMKMMMGMLSKKKPEELSDDDKGLISSYGKTVSFMDEAVIEPLLAHVLSFNTNA